MPLESLLDKDKTAMADDNIRLDELAFSKQKLLHADLYNQFLLKLITEKALFDAMQISMRTQFNVSVNERGLTPLQEALIKQDFQRAEDLIEQGASFGSKEKAIYDVAIRSKKGEAYDRRAENLKEATQMPLMKEFGLTLGIEATGKDGTYSQFSYVGPAYGLMTNIMNDYAKNDPSYKEIAEAYVFTNKASDFRYNRASNENATKEISQRIQEGKITSIPTNCDGHMMAMTIVPDKVNGGANLVFTDRGAGGVNGTQIFHVSDVSKLDAKFVKSMMSGVDNDTPHHEVMAKIQSVVDPKHPIQTIPQKQQKYDNCSIANPRSNVEGVLLCQRANALNVSVSKISNQEKVSVKQTFKSFSTKMRENKVQELCDKIRENPDNSDLKKLAHAYINSPYRSEKDKGNVEKLQSALNPLQKDTSIVTASKIEHPSQKSTTPESSITAGNKRNPSKH